MIQTEIPIDLPCPDTVRAREIRQARCVAELDRAASKLEASVDRVEREQALPVASSS